MTPDPDTTRPPVPSWWRRMDPLDPIGQLYDDADCDSWNVPGRLSTGPCDPAGKGDYDRAGCVLRSYGADTCNCDGVSTAQLPFESALVLIGGFDLDNAPQMRPYYDCGDPAE